MHKFMVPAAAVLLQFLSAPLASAAPAGARVEVLVNGVQSAKGWISVSLCTEGTWLKRCAISARAAARPGVTTVVVNNVPPGRYGAVVFHDENANGTADRNVLGIPTEDIGFSRDAMKRLAAPAFADAVFAHGKDTRRISLKLKNF